MSDVLEVLNKEYKSVLSEPILTDYKQRVKHELSGKLQRPIIEALEKYDEFRKRSQIIMSYIKNVIFSSLNGIALEERKHTLEDVLYSVEEDYSSLLNDLTYDRSKIPRYNPLIYVLKGLVDHYKRETGTIEDLILNLASLTTLFAGISGENYRDYTLMRRWTTLPDYILRMISLLSDFMGNTKDEKVSYRRIELKRKIDWPIIVEGLLESQDKSEYDNPPIIEALTLDNEIDMVVHLLTHTPLKGYYQLVLAPLNDKNLWVEVHGRLENLSKGQPAGLCDISILRRTIKRDDVDKFISELYYALLRKNIVEENTHDFVRKVDSVLSEMGFSQERKENSITYIKEVLVL